jgi:hypothetical protein
MFLIKNLFNIIKFELKIYDSILNNVIKIVYINFLSGHAVRLTGSIIGGAGSFSLPSGDVRDGYQWEVQTPDSWTSYWEVS